MGFARSDQLRELASTILNSRSEKRLGATGSRLLTGNMPIAEELEKKMLFVCLSEGGRVAWESIYFDGKNHVAWYYQITNHGAGIF